MAIDRKDLFPGRTPSDFGLTIVGDDYVSTVPVESAGILLGHPLQTHYETVVFPKGMGTDVEPLVSLTRPSAVAAHEFTVHTVRQVSGNS